MMRGIYSTPFSEDTQLRDNLAAIVLAKDWKIRIKAFQDSKTGWLDNFWTVFELII